jgi:hypothetical protein
MEETVFGPSLKLDGSRPRRLCGFNGRLQIRAEKLGALERVD